MEYIGKTSKIQRVSMVDQVFTQLKTEICNGVYQIGDRLPSESELADAYGVNRLTVRMAIQKLNTLGFAETRVGEGSFVCPFSFTTYLSAVSEICLSPQKLDEVRLLRKMLEIETVKLVMQHGTDADYEKLEECLNAYLQAGYAYFDDISEENLHTFVDRDLEFHQEICLLSKNELFYHLYLLLRPLIKQHLQTLLTSRVSSPGYLESLKGSADGHVTLLEQMRASDWNGCKQTYMAILDLDDDME